jgi:hypothetical protein
MQRICGTRTPLAETPVLAAWRSSMYGLRLDGSLLQHRHGHEFHWVLTVDSFRTKIKIKSNQIKSNQIKSNQVLVLKRQPHLPSYYFAFKDIDVIHLNPVRLCIR